MAGCRILLADSDPEVQQTVRLVASNFDHEIILAATGAEALAQAAAWQPDIIVLDTLFPDANGRDVLERLKTESSTAHIPVVVWSGGREERESDRRIALELGAADYVNMVNAQLLMLRLERLLLRISGAHPAQR